MNRDGLLIPVLGLLVLFFGWKSYGAWTAPPYPVAPAAVNPKAVALAAPPAGTPRTWDLSAAVTTIVVRPLFRPDRQPYQETASAVPQRNYEAELGRYTVVGVLFIDGVRKAIVTGSVLGKTERYEVGAGEALPGFAVKEVRQDGVLLVADGREFTLPLYAAGPKGSAALRTEPAAQKPAPVSQGTAPITAAPAQGRPGVSTRTQPVPPPPARRAGPTVPGIALPVGNVLIQPRNIPGVQ